jgi:hypothetical protein
MSRFAAFAVGRADRSNNWAGGRVGDAQSVVGLA